MAKLVDQYGGIGSDDFEAVDARETVMREIRKCTDRQQLILMMRMDGYDNRYIAEHLCISESTVRVLFLQAKEKIKNT